MNIGDCVLHNYSWWISCCDCSCFYCVFHSLYCHFHRIWWMHLDATAYWGFLLRPLQPAFAHVHLTVSNFFVPSVQKAFMSYHVTSFSLFYKLHFRQYQIFQTCNSVYHGLQQWLTNELFTKRTQIHKYERVITSKRNQVCAFVSTVFSLMSAPSPISAPK